VSSPLPIQTHTQINFYVRVQQPCGSHPLVYPVPTALEAIGVHSPGFAGAWCPQVDDGTLFQLVTRLSLIGGTLMPKQRPPFDSERYTSLKAQGFSQRAIAQEMGMPEATLRNNLKVLAQSVGTSWGDLGTPPLYVHPGVPDESEESPVGGEDVAGVHAGIPALPLSGRPEGHLGTPEGGVSPHLVEALTAAWPDLQHMLAWWRQRQTQAAHGPLVRHTFHIDERWLEAIRRESDMTGESYAAILNRALAAYFAARST